MCELAKAHAIPCIDMLPILTRYRDEHQLPYPYFWFEGDGHWNPLAHRIAAETVGEYILNTPGVCGYAVSEDRD
jgi:hypothetical protein